MEKSVICIAGKNSIAIEAVHFIQKKYPQYTVVGLPNTSDTGMNGYFRSFKDFLKQHNIAKTSVEEIQKESDVVFISLEFDQIINPDHFISNKLYNIHFSLLPAYKGMYTSAWPILNGETKSGVTLHEINRGIDTGDIIDQISFDLSGEETVKTLYQKYLDHGISLIKRNLDALIMQSFSKKPQLATGSTYFSKKSIDYKNLKIDLKVTASQLHAQIRAFTYREYQMPFVYNSFIYKGEITNKPSNTSAGKLLYEDKFTITLSTIDFDVILYKDRFAEFAEACRINDINLVKMLFDKFYLEERTPEGWTPLMIACYNNSVESAIFLLENNADINAVNHNGTTVLMYAKSAACETSDFTILNLILSRNPDIQQTDYNNKNVLDYVKSQSQSVYNYLKTRQNDKLFRP